MYDGSLRMSPPEPSPSPGQTSGVPAEAAAAPERPRHGGGRGRRAVHFLIGLLAVYGVAAYIVAPWIWHRVEERHPALEGIPTITHTGSGIPGDALNIAVIGTEEQLHRAMLAAGWYPADPITLESSLRIAADTVLRRPFDEAPVSNLYLFGRKEDFAFEQPIGDDPRKRNHVRFWKSQKVDSLNRPLWAGAATQDVRVGLSHTTGQITHHTGPDIDAERDHLVKDLEQTGRVESLKWIDNFQPDHQGTNGGGDPWTTDGRLAVVTLRPS